MSQKSKRLFGQAVKLLCGREGYSQKGLASELDADEAYVSKICAGKVLPLKYIDDIATYLGVPISRLFSERPLEGLPDPQPPTKPVANVQEAMRLLAGEIGYSVKFSKRRPKPVKKN